MKKVRIITNRNQISQPEVQDSSDLDISDNANPVNTEIIIKKPTQISNRGFTSWIRKIKATDEGMESEIHEPMIISNSGHKVKEAEIQGCCNICEGYDNFIFNCNVYGCKKSLCLKHVYFFEQNDKKIPYCLEHYNQVVDQFDTWSVYENKIRKNK